jgi:hypothetical protein
LFHGRAFGTWVEGGDFWYQHGRCCHFMLSRTPTPDQQLTSSHAVGGKVQNVVGPYVSKHQRTPPRQQTQPNTCQNKSKTTQQRPKDISTNTNISQHTYQIHTKYNPQHPKLLTYTSNNLSHAAQIHHNTFYNLDADQKHFKCEAKVSTHIPNTYRKAPNVQNTFMQNLSNNSCTMNVARLLFPKRSLASSCCTILGLCCQRTRHSWVTQRRSSSRAPWVAL